jgi:hypothetical protein
LQNLFWRVIKRRRDNAQDAGVIRWCLTALAGAHESAGLFLKKEFLKSGSENKPRE